MSTTARNRTQAKYPDAKKPPDPPRAHASTTELRAALPVRPLGPHSASELACARAALANATARLPIPVIAWQPLADGRAHTILGATVIIHTEYRAAVFTAYTPCPYGAWHEHTVTGEPGLTEARTNAARCRTPHVSDEALADLTRGPRGQTPTVLPLGERIAATETTEMSAAEIAAGLAERAAGVDQPKEHPEP